MLAVALECAIARRDHTSEESDWRTRSELLSSAVMVQAVQLLSEMREAAKTQVDTFSVSRAEGMRRRMAGSGRTP
jgi:hypothetical protein